MLETGCRIGEILALTWANVKWRENVLLIEGDVAKNEEPRDVPMTALVRALLEMRRHAPDGFEFSSSAFVFGDAVGEHVQSAREPWEKLCTAVAIADLHVHDLRREFACRLRESGAPDHEVGCLARSREHLDYLDLPEDQPCHVAESGQAVRSTAETL